MRPVFLEMNGFASFRERAVVDFSDADFFALVGPTGSGKSTVIDAMTFALYGSVPRWDNELTVSPALAPTVTRGTVRLLFDVGGSRYVAAREVRRAANGTVGVKSVRFERLANAAGGLDPDEPTDVLAADAAGMKDAVAQLLGLSFSNFCTCVVLPQGDFAKFLHAKPADRQRILTKLLGLDVYEEVAREAGQEANRQRARAEFLTEQLGTYADATPEAQAAADQRVNDMTALSGRVDAAVSRLRAAHVDLTHRLEVSGRLASERAMLAGVVVPDEATQLDVRARSARDALTTATAALQKAEQADRAARDKLNAAPPRQPFEQALREIRELAAALEREQSLQAESQQAAAELESATATAAQARTAVERGRSGVEEANGPAREAHEEAARLHDECRRLGAVTIPPGLDDIAERAERTALTLHKARQELTSAEAEDESARQAQEAAAPTRAPLERALGQLGELATALPEEGEAERRLAEATTDRRRTARDVAAAEAEVAAARERRDTVTRLDAAAALRPHLVAGDACPVCEQPVATLPPPMAAADLSEAESLIARGESAVAAARAADAGAVRAEHEAAAAAKSLQLQIDELRKALDGASSVAEVEAHLAGLVELDRAAAAAVKRVRAARAARDAAEAEQVAVTSELQRDAETLSATRDPLVPLGAPSYTSDVVADWRALGDWAAQTGRERAKEAARADAEKVRAAGVLADAEKRLIQAEAQADTASKQEQAATRAEQHLSTQLGEVTAAIAALLARLAESPTEAEAEEGLAKIDAISAALERTHATVLGAREARTAAEAAHDDVRRETQQACERLRDVRDPLVPLGAPPIAGEDLLADWQAMAAWAAEKIRSHDKDLPAAEKAVAKARAAMSTKTAGLRADLERHDIAAPPEDKLADVATAQVAAGVERARAESARLADAREKAGTIAAEQQQAEEAEQVARMLANLLRADGFPRWLVSAALDTLVAEASDSLSELSQGQFELDHEKGSFVVIDHADADSRRPVKTLSGGETFQASLSLALALSSHMSTLAAAGGARLESIFLDEGFGTLDESTLDTVAATLENLAAGGQRMVGVITHVAALAERIPVRFAVARDTRTSSIAREAT